MVVTITAIKNLTTSATVTDLGNYSFKTGTTDTITIKEEAAKLEWKTTDNIQVTWSDGTNEKRAVNGTLDSAKNTISGLVDVSKYSVGINGQIGIGPVAKPDAVLVSIRLGNIPSERNLKADWIIDFSDKQDGAPGTSIKLNELVEWIQSKSGDTATVSFPPSKEGDKKLEDYSIEFKEFYYNVTQNTFDFNVQSKDGDTIQFGNFTIKKVGFRVTNTPQTVAKKAIEKA